MKYHIAFLTGLLLVLGLFSYFIFSGNEKGLFYFHEDREAVEQIIGKFQETHPPKVSINFSALYKRRGQLQVLHPILDVTRFQIEKVRHLCSGETDQNPFVDSKEVSCSSSVDSELDSYAALMQKKTEVLSHFLYENGELPETFFSVSPYVDQRGISYAYWIVKKAPRPFNEEPWVEAHLSFFKVSELKELLSVYQIAQPVYSTIADLSESEVEKVVRGEPLVLTSKYLLVKDQSSFGFSPLAYLVYDLPAFQNAIKDGNYDLVLESSTGYCLQKVGNACWTYSSKYALSYLYKYSVAIAGLLGLIFIIFLGFYLRRLYEKNKEQKKHRLSLQVLSHEFRTPVSSMLLMIEQLRKASQKLDISDQDLLTRISTEIFRLQRVVEVSKTYLQAEGSRIHFKAVEIPSLNQWVEDYVAETGLSIQCELLQKDQSLATDPFWLKFILSNLVQNAFAHGAEPVKIHLDNAKGILKISVQDQGKCDYNSLNKMAEPFVKSQQSKGMGIGLNIVQHIVDEWGGEIHFSKNPTSFTLSLDSDRFKGI